MGVVRVLVGCVLRNLLACLGRVSFSSLSVGARMTQPSDGQRRQELLFTLQAIHDELRVHEWRAGEADFHFLIRIVDDSLKALTKGL